MYFYSLHDGRETKEDEGISLYSFLLIVVTVINVFTSIYVVIVPSTCSTFLFYRTITRHIT